MKGSIKMPKKKKNLKIAIYAICKNELQFVDKWFMSMLEADYICVLDTGSTDGTYEALLKWQERFPEKIIISQKTYEFWRFDTPRNDSLSLVPEDTDIYWCTDLDEVLEPGWSVDLKNNWKDNQTRGLYLYAWSHTESGDPGRIFWYDKVHTKDYKWLYPVHETLFYVGDGEEKVSQFSSRVLLHHYPDLTKSRSNYLKLLELRTQENPEDFYGMIYLAHEYLLQSQPKKCIQYITNCALPKVREFPDALFMPDMYLFLGDAYKTENNYVFAEQNYRLGIASFSAYRENYLSLAVLLMEQNRVLEARDIMEEMFKKTIRFYSWLERDLSWSWLPYDIMAWIYLSLGNKHLAADYAFLAYSLNPIDVLKNKYENIRKELDQNANCDLIPLSELKEQNKVQ